MFLSDSFFEDKISYNPGAGQYTKQGRFISAFELDSLAISEKTRLATKLERLSKQLTTEKISLGQWENSLAEELKLSHIRLTILASGGKKRTGLNAYGIAGRNLKKEYKLLNNFAHQIAEGKLSKKQVIARSKLYAQSTLQTYYEVYQYNKLNEGFKSGWRSVDPMAKHCAQCPTYVTRGWEDIKKIVPKGAKCDCRGNCRCSIRYRKF